MKMIWKSLSYLLVPPLPDAQRAAAPPAQDRRAPAAPTQPAPSMVRWREVIRASLLNS